MRILLTDALHYVSQISLSVLRYPRQRLHWRHLLGHVVLSLSMLTPTGTLSGVFTHGVSLPAVADILGPNVLLPRQRPTERSTAALGTVRLSLFAGRVLGRRVLAAFTSAHMLSSDGMCWGPITSLL